MTERPNIILIITDQQRFDTLAAWGYDHMITPNMDRLVEEGVSFRQAYCPGATCISSRAATFTGMYAHNTGVYSFQPWSHQRLWVQDLADAGYHCVSMGKMHLDPRDAPAGYEERVIVENPTNTEHLMGRPDDDWGRYLRWHGALRPNRRNHTDPDWMDKYQGVAWHLEEHLHSDVFIGTAATAWIDEYRGEEPFFLEVGFTGPHEPWDPLPHHLEMYEGRELPGVVRREGELDEKPKQHRAQQDYFAHTHGEAQIQMSQIDDAGMDRMRRHYYAKITTVDEQIGRVLASLEARGWLDNSLILFCSDHGELLGDHYVPYKWLMYDPIVHIPLVIRHPGSVDSPSEVNELVSLIDLGPTILQAAGVDAPVYLEGHSLLPYLNDEEISPRQYVFCEDNYQIMMRSADHKLVYYIGQELGELYDLRADPDELHNLWEDADHAATKQGLLNELLAWLATSNYYNAGYKWGKLPNYELRFPGGDDDGKLIGPNTRPRRVSVL